MSPFFLKAWALKLAWQMQYVPTLPPSSSWKSREEEDSLALVAIETNSLPAPLQGGEEEIGPCLSEHQDDTPLLNLSASRASPRPSSLTSWTGKAPGCYLTAVWVLFQGKVSRLYGIVALDRECQNTFWSLVSSPISIFNAPHPAASPLKVYPLCREAVCQLVQSPLSDSSLSLD